MLYNHWYTLSLIAVYYNIELNILCYEKVKKKLCFNSHYVILKYTKLVYLHPKIPYNHLPIF